MAYPPESYVGLNRNLAEGIKQHGIQNGKNHSFVASILKFLTSSSKTYVVLNRNLDGDIGASWKFRIAIFSVLTSKMAAI